MVRSLLPLPITVNLFSLKSISFILIPTSSDKRIPQFKNRVMIAKSLSLYSLASFLVTSKSFWLFSKDKYLGSLFSCLGVSKPIVGSTCKTFSLFAKYLKNTRILAIFLALVAGLL